MKKGEKPKGFRCEECKSKQTYILNNGTRVCRKCGHRKKGDKKK